MEGIYYTELQMVVMSPSLRQCCHVVLISIQKIVMVTLPLMIAAFSGKMEAVNYLLDKGADLSLKGQYGRNLLHKASNGGNVAIIETMLSRGLDINSKDSNGHTALMIAAFSGKMEAVNYLLDKGSRSVFERPAMEGIYYTDVSNGSNVAIIETMLSRGLDINSKDSNGDTPLMIAAFSGKMEAVNYLLDKGADPSLTRQVVEGIYYTALQRVVMSPSSRQCCHVVLISI